MQSESEVERSIRSDQIDSRLEWLAVLDSSQWVDAILTDGALRDAEVALLLKFYRVHRFVATSPPSEADKGNLLNRMCESAGVELGSPTAPGAVKNAVHNLPAAETKRLLYYCDPADGLDAEPNGAWRILADAFEDLRNADARWDTLFSALDAAGAIECADRWRRARLAGETRQAISEVQALAPDGDGETLTDTIEAAQLKLDVLRGLVASPQQ